MYCKNCGNQISIGEKFCGVCGKPIQVAERKINSLRRGRIGFSPKINDPAFTKYIKNSNKWSILFAVIIATVAIIGFFIAGETSSELENPQSLFIGLGIGGMFISIALFNIKGRKRSKTWDGTVVNKKIEKKGVGKTRQTMIIIGLITLSIKL